VPRAGFGYAPLFGRRRGGLGSQ